MSDSDDTWEEFFGPSTELMPSILTALDGILDSQTQQIDSSREDLRSPSPRRIHQATHFYNLSFNVQKILSNISDEETNRRFASDENLLLKRLYGNNGGGGVHKKPSLEKSLYKSNESLELMSPNVQKMLSNLPDTELVIPNGVLHPDAKKANKNSSFLYAAQKTDDDTCRTCDKAKTVDGEDDESADPEFTSRPLGSYGNTSPSGIASRRPVGRKNMGKYLQVPSESSLVTSSTTSSEVSRPVSLTSLGSCSSSGSSGTHQPGSAYQASAESLDSDPEPSNIQGSADSGIAEESTAVNTREYDVVAEIVETEAKYVEDLHKVIQDYLEPMRCHPDRRLHCDHPDLFGNLEQIYDFNSSFLGQLREAKLDPSEIAKVFINNSGFSPIYTDYCTDYPKTIAVLTKLMGNEETAWYFRDVQSRKEHDLPLGSYLLKPVQRILKYRLLLERLLEICKEEHKSVVDLALTTMLRVADHINSMKRKHENAVRIQEIQSQLYGWTGQDLTTLGELIAEGTFRVAGGQKGKRHVFLFDKLLLLTKCKHDGCFAYRTHIMCSNLMLIEQVNGDPLSFHVLPFDNHKLQCTLRAKSPQNKREWTAQLKRVIIENFNGVVPDHAQQLLMQLGQDLPEQEANVESWTPLKQHSTPQYLEKRSRVRKSTDFSTRRSASHDRSFPTLSWRRKSEPNVEPQLYDTKTVPTRISKIKKAKESTAIFYTGFFDSDTCEVIDESNDRAEAEAAPTGAEKKDECPTEQGDHDHDHDRHHTSFSDSIGKVVTAIIMQSEEFNKAIGRRKRGLVESETVPNICRKPDKDLVTNKADSLPRSFQLNDQIDSTNCSSESLHRNDASQKETYTETETDTSSQVDTNEHPEHKIYRKSEIRSSFLQKYALRYRYKRSVLKETSKIIGARIANPDYEDPQKLYPMTSTNQSNSGASTKPEGQDLEFNAPTDLDLTINETEVLTEFDRRLQSTDCAQKIKSSQSTPTITVDANDSANLNSSQNSDNYYESIFEKSLNEEVVERCDSFRSTGQRQIVTRFLTATSDTTTTTTKKLTVSSPLQERRNVQRPSVAPPPIPAKPTRCLKPDNKPHMTNRENIETSTNLNRNGGAPANNEQSKGWVETLRRRFE